MTAAADDRRRLRADCASCAGLCCVAPAFAASADFAVDKPAGVACRHLQRDSRCGIHGELRERGFPGCTVFDCFGAGQQKDPPPPTARTLAAGPCGRPAAFGVQRLLHELLWYLAEALALDAAAPLHRELGALRERAGRLTAAAPAELAAVDTTVLQAEAGALLGSVSELARSGLRPRGRDRRGADLVAADLRRRPPAGARRERASGGGRGVLRLAGALFLTRRQVAAARGDAATVLPDGLEHPARWEAT
ncbi:pentapeptide repeat-containing protein [Geodermatophilus sp. DSM 44513]|uniref:pentapeptide repeat-containing protein n=1 Tax=Geodermatophilus sp. DSM 44513 TaxID=1528104 RepID=UPI0028F6CBB9|nr:pentapeptide repeat-containing protein [Geodermatophilus sp. DSM 44513]WNV73792.1 pentapeptide repeat-containing protein [Geodermatophilus sp. DSM 44513]